jgi:hypothetical protein
MARFLPRLDVGALVSFFPFFLLRFLAFPRLRRPAFPRPQCEEEKAHSPGEGRAKGARKDCEREARGEIGSGGEVRERDKSKQFGRKSEKEGGKKDKKKLALSFALTLSSPFVLHTLSSFAPFIYFSPSFFYAFFYSTPRPCVSKQTPGGFLGL